MITLQILTQGINEHEATKQDVDMSLLQLDLDSILKKEGSCRIALGLAAHPQLFSQTGGGITPITLYKTDGSVFLSTTAPNNQYGRLTITGIFLTTTTQVHAWTALEPENLWGAQLTITAQKPTGLIGAPTLVRASGFINIQVDQTTGNIVACSSLSFIGGGVPQLVPICKSDEALFSDGVQISCVKTICPPGLSIKSYSVTAGTVQCGP